MEYPAEVRLEVYDAIIEYAASGKLSELKPLSKMAFSFIKKEIDYNNDRYRETVSKRSEAGKKGMTARYANQQDVTNLTKGNKTNTCYQGVTNLTNVTDNDNDNDNVNDNGEGIIPPSPFLLPLDECKQELRQDTLWLETFAMNNRLPTTDAVCGWIDKFFAQLQNEGVTHKYARDAKSHFARWYAIKAGKAQDDTGESLQDRILNKLKNKEKQ